MRARHYRRRCRTLLYHRKIINAHTYTQSHTHTPLLPTMIPASPHTPTLARYRLETGTAFTDMDDYHRMWQGIQDSGRPMVLTVEGSPVDSIITHGGYVKPAVSLHMCVRQSYP